MPTTSAKIDWTPTLQAILGPDPGSQLYGEVSLWFHKLQIFRKGENQRIFQAEPTSEDLEIHRHLLLRLVEDGEHLLRVIHQSKGLIRNPENIKTEDLAAALEGLRDTDRGLHNPLPPERREKVIQEVFGNVA
jgi:hypothetical protein